MSDTTPMLALPLLAAAQAQKHVTHNEALLLLDAAVQLAVIDRTRTAPPASPAAGDRYLVAAGAGGDWAGKDGRIALYDGSAWRFLMPRAGWRTYVIAEALSLGHDGTGWRDVLVATPSGGGLALRAAEVDVVLSGASVVTPLVIPDRAICLGVASRTLQAVTGASAYRVGIAGEEAKFGDSLGVSVGASNIGVIGPQAFYAATPVRVSAVGSAFTGGRVRLVLYTLGFSAPGA